VCVFVSSCVRVSVCAYVCVCLFARVFICVLRTRVCERIRVPESMQEQCHFHAEERKVITQSRLVTRSQKCILCTCLSAR
jgi:hypothetical protein